MTVQAWQQALERIEVGARQLSPRQVALTLLTLPFFLVGFVAAKVLGVLWIVVAWGWVAVLDGWQQAGGIRGRKREVPL